jgi:hypothetical protein
MTVLGKEQKREATRSDRANKTRNTAKPACEEREGRDWRVGRVYDEPLWNAWGYSTPHSKVSTVKAIVKHTWNSTRKRASHWQW